MTTYLIFRTFVLEVEADSEDEAADIASELDMNHWEFHNQEVQEV